MISVPLARFKAGLQAHTLTPSRPGLGPSCLVCSQAEWSGSEPGEGARLPWTPLNKSSRQLAQEPGSQWTPGLWRVLQGGAGFRPYRAEMQALAAALLPGEQDLGAREGWGPGLAAGLKLGERQSLRAWSCGNKLA